MIITKSILIPTKKEIKIDLRPIENCFLALIPFPMMYKDKPAQTINQAIAIKIYTELFMFYVFFELVNTNLFFRANRNK